MFQILKHLRPLIKIVIVKKLQNNKKEKYIKTNLLNYSFYSISYSTITKTKAIFNDIFNNLEACNQDYSS